MNQSTMEELLTKPIKRAGYQIGPILTKNIQDREMKLRRYAIGGLEEIKYKPATLTLKQILLDKTEPDFLRADALQTLVSFNTNESIKIVSDFKMQATDSIDKKVIDLVDNGY